MLRPALAAGQHAARPRTTPLPVTGHGVPASSSCSTAAPALPRGQYAGGSYHFDNCRSNFREGVPETGVRFRYSSDFEIRNSALSPPATSCCHGSADRGRVLTDSVDSDVVYPCPPLRRGQQCPHSAAQPVHKRRSPDTRVSLPPPPDYPPYPLCRAQILLALSERCPNVAAHISENRPVPFQKTSLVTHNTRRLSGNVLSPDGRMLKYYPGFPMCVRRTL